MQSRVRLRRGGTWGGVSVVKVGDVFRVRGVVVGAFDLVVDPGSEGVIVDIVSRESWAGGSGTLETIERV